MKIVRIFECMFEIEYQILPIHYKISLCILKTEDEFKSVINKYQGQLIERNIDSSKFDPAFVLKFPSYDYHARAKLYKLSDGNIAVDQFIINKSNPYFICKSIFDFEVVSKYLSIFFIDELPKPIIQCKIFEHFHIKSFLNEHKLEYVEKLSDGEFKLFKANNGQYVYVRYNKNFLKGGKRDVAIDSKYINEDEVYYSAIIYENLDVMYKLGELIKF